MHRPTVALLTALLIVGATVMWLWPPDPDNATLASLHGALVRMSILMAALWLAEPALRRYPPWMILIGIVGGVLLLAALRQPAIFRVAIPVLVILWLTRRKKRTADGGAGSAG
jgi:hypothetical protein